jgi:bifunctional non-homologous end joining protein LigD
VDRLADYRGKRDPARTPEPVPPGPPGKAAGPAGRKPVFVVQEHHARRLHWDFRLERDGVLVSWALPKGVPDDPAVNHLAVHTEDHPLEYAGFHGEIPRGEYGAGAVTLWDRGTYEVLKWDEREVKVDLHGERVSGGYVLFATGGKNWMIHRERQPLPAALTPMLAAPGTPPARGLAEWSVEFKWDGVRALAFIEAGRLRLISRTGKDITATYPEVSALGSVFKHGAVAHGQVLLDGEIVAFADGRPDFEALQPRMHVSSPAQALRLAEQTPVTYLVFDVLQLDGRPLTGRPYADRRQLLESLVPNGAAFHVPPAFPGEDLDAVRAASVANGFEGVVIKRLDSGYEPGSRSGSWRKLKNVLRQEVVVAGWKPGKGNRLGLIGSLLVGCYCDGALEYCGHVGTGFSDETLRLLTRRLAPLRRPDSPFDGPVPPEYARSAVWAEPRLVIDVTFDRWTRAGRMIAPAYQGLRNDKEPADVIRET